MAVCVAVCVRVCACVCKGVCVPVCVRVGLISDRVAYNKLTAFTMHLSSFLFNIQIMSDVYPGQFSGRC